MRRTGRQEDSQTRLWRVVDTATGLSLSGLWRTERDLGAATGSRRVRGPALRAPARDGPGLHPRCARCLLRHQGPTDRRGCREGACVLDVEVLECSHLSGHRFAGTALTLPDGLCYGRLDQSDAPKVMKAHAEGRVWPDKLRGQTGLVGAAQAAHVWGLENLPPAPGAPTSP